MNPFQKNESKETLFSPVSIEDVPPRPPNPPKKPSPVSPQIQSCLWQEWLPSFGSLPWAPELQAELYQGIKMILSWIQNSPETKSKQKLPLHKKTKQQEEVVKFLQLGSRDLMNFIAYSVSLGEKSNLNVQGNLASILVWRTMCDCSFFTNIKTLLLVLPVCRAFC